MVLIKKTSQQLSTTANVPNTVEGVDNTPIKSLKTVNHWAFLDEIEAPMWADLKLECVSTYEDKDDEWFNIFHPVHQCSSRKSTTTAFHNGGCLTSLDTYLDGQSPPKLPTSVSKSRGKDYKSRKQEPVNVRFILNKQHRIRSVSSKSSFISAVPKNSLKNNAVDRKVKDHNILMSDSVGESTLTETTEPAISKSACGFSNKCNSFKFLAFEEGERISKSTITSEPNEQRPIDVSSRQAFSHTNALLSTLRVSLKKSRVTRQASRVEIKSTRQLDSRKSLSSKSSVGSSSHPGSDGMNLALMENMDRTPISRNTTTMSQIPTNKLNRANVYKAPTDQAWGVSCNSKLNINEEARKATDHKKPAKAYFTRKESEHVSIAAAKMSMRARGINHFSKTLDGGKENQAERIGLGFNSSTRIKEAEGIVRDPKVVKRKMHQKSEKINLVGPRENCRVRNTVKKYTNKVETISFDRKSARH